jgi:putative transposase
LRLRRREESWKNAEILLLPAASPARGPAAAARARPKPSWADRALIAALLGVIPRARQAGLRMIVTPDMVLRWHRALRRPAVSSSR